MSSADIDPNLVDLELRGEDQSQFSKRLGSTQWDVMTNGHLKCFMSHHLISCQAILPVCVHCGSAGPGCLQIEALAPIPAPLSGHNPTTGRRVGKIIGKSLRPRLCQVYPQGSEGWF